MQHCLRPYLYRICWCIPEGALRRLSSTIATNLPSVRLSRSQPSSKTPYDDSKDFKAKMFPNVNEGFDSDACDSDKSFDVDCAVRDTEESDAGDLDSLDYIDSPVPNRKMSPLVLGNLHTNGKVNVELTSFGTADAETEETGLTNLKLPAIYDGQANEDQMHQKSSTEPVDDPDGIQDSSAIVDNIFSDQKLNYAVKEMLSGNLVTPQTEMKISTEDEDMDETTPAEVDTLDNPGDDAEDEQSDDEDIFVSTAEVTNRASVWVDAIVEVDSD